MYDATSKGRKSGAKKKYSLFLERKTEACSARTSRVCPSDFPFTKDGAWRKGGNSETDVEGFLWSRHEDNVVDADADLGHGKKASAPGHNYSYERRLR